ncbi:FadR/GntR family transcriptional regulator [Puerhibacterium sp. TATVAM-FAB25]|uniref:FadR/GntR family transcriptional regulator n=1 Tax=Puerhibacterium sp. TATVAM-FAB25 TaxID=3093699 RepID=UPI00397CFD54
MRAHELVLARVEADLAAGRWALGERLPGERALAEELGVSRPSVREAIRVLEAMGIVRTAVGSGPGAGATVIGRPAAGLGAAVRLHVASGTLPVADVVATRAVLEAWAVGQAAARWSDDEDGDLREILEAMRAPGLAVPDFVALDQDFHLALVRCCGNPLVEAVLAGLRAAVGSYVPAGAQRLTAWPEHAARLGEEHGQILAAVRAGDVAAAEEHARRHIWGFSEQAGLAREDRGAGTGR